MAHFVFEEDGTFYDILDDSFTKEEIKLYKESHPSHIISDEGKIEQFFIIQDEIEEWKKDED